MPTIAPPPPPGATNAPKAPAASTVKPGAGATPPQSFVAKPPIPKLSGDQSAAKGLDALVKEAFKPAAAPAAETPAAVPAAEPAKAPDAAPPKTDVAPIAPPAPAAPPAEVDHFSDVKPADITKPRAEEWNTLKKLSNEKLTAAEKRAIAAEQQLEALKKTPVAEAAELERVKTEYQQAKDRLAILDVQSHPDFISNYVKPRDEALAAAKEIIGYTGAEAGDLNKLLTLPQKDFNAEVAKITEKMNSMDATAVQTSLRQAHQLKNREAMAMQDSQKLRQALEEKAVLKQREAFEEVYKEVGYDSGYLIPQIPEGTPPEDVAELTGIAEAMKAAKTNAEKYAFGKLTAKEAAQLAAKAAHLEVHVQKVIPYMYKDRTRLVEQNKALLAELTQLKAAKATPAVSSTPAPAAAPSTPATPPNMAGMSGEAKIMSLVRGAGFKGTA